MLKETSIEKPSGCLKSFLFICIYNDPNLLKINGQFNHVHILLLTHQARFGFPMGEKAATTIPCSWQKLTNSTLLKKGLTSTWNWKGTTCLILCCLFGIKTRGVKERENILYNRTTHLKICWLNRAWIKYSFQLSDSEVRHTNGFC